MERIRIETALAYDVLVGEGLLARAGELCREVADPCRVCLVADSVVAGLYGDGVADSLRAAGFEVFCFIFPHGEASKNLGTLGELLEFMAQSGLDRGDLAVALGGGVTGDMTGFAAAVYLRGIRFVQLSTTLLGQVDASVGGKTAVDLGAGKNLAGAFHQPLLVACDTGALATLPPEQTRQGMAEVIKTAAVLDAEMFGALETGDIGLQEIVARCVAIKGGIVARDEKETGERKVLNFGHTVGHAVELHSGYTLLHGDAVAIGMMVVARAAVAAGWCAVGVPGRLEALLQKHGLPTRCMVAPGELVAACLRDKKRAGDSITWVLPVDIGRYELRQLPVAGLEALIASGI